MPRQGKRDLHPKPVLSLTKALIRSDCGKDELGFGLGEMFAQNSDLTASDDKAKAFSGAECHANHLARRQLPVMPCGL